MPKTIDNISEHHTPEGLILALVPAGIMPRLSAWLLDFFIRIAVMIVLIIIFTNLGDMGYGMILISYFLINWLYPVFFEVWRGGMTPGKKSNHIYVCHDDGTPISLQSSMIRNLLRVADFMPMFFMGGALTMMFNKKSQRIGDMVAGTMVVYQLENDMANIYKTVAGIKPFAQTNSMANTHYDVYSPLFTFQLNYHEQKALLSLEERLGFLSTERQQEITYHLAPLVNLAEGVMQQNNQQVVFDATLQKMYQLKGNTQQGNTQQGHTQDNVQP